MIKEIIKVNSLPKGTAAVNGLGENLPETEPMIINVARIESIIPPATTVDPGAFAMRYAGETIYVSNECFHDLMQCWVDANRIIEFTKLKSEGTHKVLDATKNTPCKRTYDPLPVTKRIRTMTDVLEELGPDHPLVEQYDKYMFLKKPEEYYDEYLLTFMKLRLVCAAINEGWLPTFANGEYWYTPYILLFRDFETAKKTWGEDAIEIPSDVQTWLNDGREPYGGCVIRATAYSESMPDGVVAHASSRLCFKSEERAIYAAKTFFELWIKLYRM